jgi:hypothetical protein
VGTETVLSIDTLKEALYMQTFSELQEVSKKYREHNDCTVKALATLFGCTYGVAHRALAKHGRKRGCGATWHTIGLAKRDLAERFGLTISTNGAPHMLPSSAKYFGHRVVTINQFMKEHPRGVYMLSVRGHVATLRDGVLYDWTADTAKRRKVTGYLKVEN